MSEEHKESSVLFSLQELMKLEQDRIKQEEDDKKRRQDNEVRAREDAERKAREEEQARLHAEEERRRLEEQRKREEAARLEALRQAEIERARVAAEEQARLDAMKAAQAHELEVAKLKQDKHKKNLTIGIGLVLAVLLIGGGTGGFIWYRSAKAQEELQAETQRQLAERDAQMKKLQSQLETQERKVNDLVSQLAAAHDDATRAKIQAELAAAQKDAAAIKGAMRGTATSGDKGSSTPKPACTCQRGDPLCSCL